MRPADRLSWYAQHFTIGEVNSTFYPCLDPTTSAPMVKCCAYQLRPIWPAASSLDTKLDESRVRPAGGSDQNLAATFRFGGHCNHFATKSRRQRTQIRFSKIDCLKCNGAKRSRRHKQSVASSSFFLRACRQRLFARETSLCAVAYPCLSRCHAQPSRAVARLRRAWANHRPAGRLIILAQPPLYAF